MKKTDFDFKLPKHLIAQTPLSDRSQSRMMVVNKNSDVIENRHFYEISDYLVAGDVLVLNNTKVLPARLYGVKEETLAKVELLLLREVKPNTWEALCGNAKAIKLGTVINFGEGILKAECIEVGEAGLRTFIMTYRGIFMEVLAEIGLMPLPPYIKEQLQDNNRYQTVYAEIDGSAAAPTAGLHFTAAILSQLRAKGVIIEYITLHVGLGTFLPVKEDDILDHKMHEEWYQMSAETAYVLNKAKAEGRRIIAVGTTSARTLESVYRKYDMFKETSDNTAIFIYPGIEIKAIDGMLTNFHLPMSTLIMFVSALASRELIMKAYQEAVTKEYRFFSLGDAMLII